MDISPSHTAIPDLIRLGRQAVQSALLRCAGNPSLPCLAAVDGTCGNGHDTLFLAETLASIEGKPHGVFAFDVQPAAVEATRARLDAAGLTGRVSLLLENHARLAEALAGPAAYPASLVWPEGASPFLTVGSTTPAPLPIAVGMYNLGFLPRSDKYVITVTETTIASLQSAAKLLAPHGLLAIHAYGGHPGGLEELTAVDDWCAALPFDEWTVAKYEFHNKTRNPEALFLAEKRKKP